MTKEKYTYGDGGYMDEFISKDRKIVPGATSSSSFCHPDDYAPDSEEVIAASKAALAAGVDTPGIVKLKIARHLGRQPESLDSFVSKWKKDHGEDLPWVVRISGLSTLYLYDDTFFHWLKSYAGQKAKLKRGRPPKK